MSAPAGAAEEQPDNQQVHGRREGGGKEDCKTRLHSN